jgi:hypothetical protein
MSEATLTITPLPVEVGTARQVVLDCRHGTTRILACEHPNGVQISEDDAVRVALARHHEAEGCRCTRQLWRQYFGAVLGELVLVRGEP